MIAEVWSRYLLRGCWGILGSVDSEKISKWCYKCRKHLTQGWSFWTDGRDISLFLRGQKNCSSTDSIETEGMMIIWKLSVA